MKADEFKCGYCGEIFTKGWSETETLAESQELFGDIPPEHQQLLCDDCFAEFMLWYRSS